MLRVLTLLLTLLGPLAPAFGQELPRIAPRPLASAFSAMKGERWDVAARLAARDGPAAEMLVEWHRLRAGQGTAAEVLSFLRDNGDWPGLTYLRKQSEAALAEASAAEILEFYADTLPQTGTGALSYAAALNATGQQGEAEATLVLAWRTLDLTSEEHDAFIKAHADLLRPHHAARLDMALWRGLDDAAQMLPLVDDATRERAKLRQLIETGKRALDARFAALPEAQRADPGIAFALFNRYLRRDQPDEAIALMLAQSRHANGLGEPQRWASWRRSLARRMMRDGQAQLAYDLASVHGLVEGAAYADLEWLSGYLALTYLDAPELALDHFQRFRAAVASPISLGRAGYWIGRTQEALGDPEAAQIAYGRAALYQTSFYGLLAAERAGVDPPVSFNGAEPFPPWQAAAFVQSDLYQVAVLALAARQREMAERFFVSLAKTLDRTGLGQLSDALGALGQPHLQVMLGKAAARRGIVLEGPYYALHPMKDMTLPVPAELALAIARRESEFDVSVVSGAGAQGLMQLMPGTARDVAGDLALDHDPARVKADWRYNAQLGAAYLAQMAEAFDGNVILIAAAYNAGPRRPARWMETNGDPRGSVETMVDWIEHIPFRETRNYVMRVAESLPVYRARLGAPALAVPFGTELIRRTVVPTATVLD